MKYRGIWIKPRLLTQSAAYRVRNQTKVQSSYTFHRFATAFRHWPLCRADTRADFYVRIMQWFFDTSVEIGLEMQWWRYGIGKSSAKTWYKCNFVEPSLSLQCNVSTAVVGRKFHIHITLYRQSDFNTSRGITVLV